MPPYITVTKTLDIELSKIHDNAVDTCMRG